MTTEGVCCYADDLSNMGTVTAGEVKIVKYTTPVVTTGYGRHYNWYAATYDVGGETICPANYHVPSWDEFLTLATELGGAGVAGGHMKNIGTTYWTTPNTGADNTSGFNGRGAGFRTTGGAFA